MVNRKGELKMAKSPALVTVAEQPSSQKAVDVLVDVVERAAAHRFTKRAPSLNDLVRMVGTASRLLRYDSVEARIEVENSVVFALAKKRQLAG
jgi:hypothetical protein